MYLFWRLDTVNQESLETSVLEDNKKWDKNNCGSSSEGGSFLGTLKDFGGWYHLHFIKSDFVKKLQFI